MCRSGAARLVSQRTGQRQIEFLVDLFKQSENFDESAIVRRVIDQAADTTGSPLAYLYFVDPARKTITLAAWRDRSQPLATMVNAEARPLARAGLFTECVRARHATSSNDLTRKPQQDGLPDLQRYLAVPMIAGDETVAVLGVGNREAGYGEEDQRNLSALSDGVWRVLQSKRAHAATLGSLQRTDVAMQGMIDSMVRMVERHDPYTAGSARRLAALAVALGREAGLDGERQHALRVAALLHDVGNIAVPTSILSKPAPLTETELAIMRTHVDEGCQLLAEIDFGAPIADIIYQSHERYDGSGYPRGLKGEEILRGSAHPRDRGYGRSPVLAASVSARGRHGSGHRHDQSRRRTTLRSAPGRGLHAAGPPARLHAAGMIRECVTRVTHSRPQVFDRHLPP